MLRSRHQMVESSAEISNAPGEKKSPEKDSTLRSSLHVPRPSGLQTSSLRVLQAIRPESKTRGETAAPWCPDARCKQLWQRLGWVRLRADYRLPPPLASPIISRSITTRLSQQHSGCLETHVRSGFFLHCRKMLFHVTFFIDTDE
ncbi:hypothetical protein VZT92_016503 [Zoarces viviparus]|uniref:Uncharacterized protein n=1 Tax=Zoarces viviparus TaxID=48416 RepID=A0AAW1EV25_ZOAVI